MTQKEKLYYLIENYHNGNYNAKSFSEQFVVMFSEGVENYSSKKEKNIMQEFCKLAERYSPYEEDLKMSSFFVNGVTFRNLFDQLYDKIIACGEDRGRF